MNIHEFPPLPEETPGFVRARPGDVGCPGWFIHKGVLERVIDGEPRILIPADAFYAGWENTFQGYCVVRRIQMCGWVLFNREGQQVADHGVWYNDASQPMPWPGEWISTVIRRLNEVQEEIAMVARGNDQEADTSGPAEQSEIANDGNWTTHEYVTVPVDMNKEEANAQAHRLANLIKEISDLLEARRAHNTELNEQLKAKRKEADEAAAAVTSGQRLESVEADILFEPAHARKTAYYKGTKRKLPDWPRAMSAEEMEKASPLPATPRVRKGKKKDEE